MKRSNKGKQEKVQAPPGRNAGAAKGKKKKVPGKPKKTMQKSFGKTSNAIEPSRGRRGALEKAETS